MKKLNTVSAKAARQENQMDKEVTEYLTSIRVQFTAVYIGATIRDKNWKCDEWRVSFDRSRAIPIRESYFTGLGHRVTMGSGVKVIEPTAASVLYSLTMDDPDGESFEDWANNFGYDSDSIKALETYKSCVRIGEELRRFFTDEQLNNIRELLQDY